MDLTAIRSRTRAVCRDTSGVMITDALVTEWANEANLDIAARTMTLQEAVASTTSDNTIPLPADFLEAISLRLGTDDDATFVDNDVWFSHSDAASSLGFTIARVWKSDIEIFPTPSGSTAYSLRYYKAPAALVNGTDIPAIPLEQHIRILSYCRFQAKLYLHELEESDRYYAAYEDGLEPRRGSKAKLNPGPLYVSVAPSSFDLDIDARHV